MVSPSIRAAAIAVCLGAFCLGAGTTSAETYTVGVEDIDYMPHSCFSTGAYHGFARELLDAFGRDHGVAFEYRPMPIMRLTAEFVTGAVDLKYPDNPHWAKAMKAPHTVVYSAPVVASVDGVSVRPEHLGRGAGRVRTLGTLRGLTPLGWLDRIERGDVALEENNSFQGLVDQALFRRVDGAYVNVAVVAYQLEHVLNRPGALVFDPTLPHTQSHLHLSSIRFPGLIGAFDAWLARNADRIAALKAEHGVENGPE